MAGKSTEKNKPLGKAVGNVAYGFHGYWIAGVKFDTCPVPSYDKNHPVPALSRIPVFTLFAV